MSDQNLARAYDEAMGDIVRLEAEIKQLKAASKEILEIARDPLLDDDEKVEQMAEVARRALGAMK